MTYTFCKVCFWSTTKYSGMSILMANLPSLNKLLLSAQYPWEKGFLVQKINQYSSPLTNSTNKLSPESTQSPICTDPQQVSSLLRQQQPDFSQYRVAILTLQMGIKRTLFTRTIWNAVMRLTKLDIQVFFLYFVCRTDSTRLSTQINIKLELRSTKVKSKPLSPWIQFSKLRQAKPCLNSVKMKGFFRNVNCGCMENHRICKLSITMMTYMNIGFICSQCCRQHLFSQNIFCLSLFCSQSKFMSSSSLFSPILYWPYNYYYPLQYLQFHHPTQMPKEPDQYFSIEYPQQTRDNNNIIAPNNPTMAALKIFKIVILTVTTALTMAAFVVNTWYNWQMYKYNLNVVPEMQANTMLGSGAFIFVMNVASNLFNPIVCAGYVMAFYLLSHRRFEILVFLIWFIFLSVFHGFMKSLIQQARPYWMDIGDVDMLEWTCYTEYGCPSGHAMLGLILIEFMIRYFSREYNLTRKPRIVLFMGGVLLQGTVIFSRIILGMHSINQVLFGALLGLYSLLPYYMYMEKFILKICLKTCSPSYRRQNLIINTLGVFIMIGLSLAVALLPSYSKNDAYMAHIVSFQGCKQAKYYQSFQYKCLIDSSLAMAVFGIIYGLVFLRNQERLMKVIKYKRISKKYILRLIFSACLAVIPVAIFMNPFWKKIDLPDKQMAIMLYFLQGAGLLTANFVLVGLAPSVLARCKLEDYFTHDQGKQYLFYTSKQLKMVQSQSQISQKMVATKAKQNLIDTYNKNDSINVPYQQEE